jgi:ABC-type polysaccharide/polyol phosphate transport system ATPase subunit
MQSHEQQVEINKAILVLDNLLNIVDNQEARKSIVESIDFLIDAEVEIATSHKVYEIQSNS